VLDVPDTCLSLIFQKQALARYKITVVLHIFQPLLLWEVMRDKRSNGGCKLGSFGGRWRWTGGFLGFVGILLL
jgi:hypothetical protein